MTRDDHLIGIGKIVGNLQAVEFLLRIFFCDAEGESYDWPDSATRDVAVNHLTNQDSLGKLIRNFNSLLSSNEGQFQIDLGIVRIRDAIAHGRPTALSKEFPVTLWKFGKPKDGRVALEFFEVLNEEWFSESLSLLREQMSKVASCSGRRGYKSLG